MGDVNTSRKGKVKLAGNLAGTASNAQITANAVDKTGLAGGAVTEPKLDVTHSPSSEQMPSWNGIVMAWATPSGGTVYDD